jgi:hypothetical protein
MVRRILSHLTPSRRMHPRQPSIGTLISLPLSFASSTSNSRIPGSSRKQGDAPKISKNARMIAKGQIRSMLSGGDRRSIGRVRDGSEMTLMPACRSNLRFWTFILVSTLGLLLLLPTGRFRAVRCTAYFGSMTSRPFIGEKWRLLNVANVLPRCNAVAATIRSYAPMTLPDSSKLDHIRAW